MLNDRLALLARLSGLTVALLIGALLVWARPCLMTWSLFLMVLGTAPGLILVVYYTAFSTPATSGPLVRVAAALLALCTFGVPFGFSFPRDTVTQWPRWVRALGCAAVIAIATIFALLVFVPFERDLSPIFVLWVPMAILATVVALFALVRTYRGIEAAERARLRWAILGMSGVLVVSLAGVIFIALAQAFPNWRSGNPLTPAHWALFIGQGLLLPLTMAYAILRQRVVDVQFAVSRTVVYGVVSTIVLFFLAVLHWLLGRVIEHSRLAFGVEGLAAVGLGLVLHRASHGINRFVDRVLFRKHHAAEERLRQVTAALPYAMTERSIAEALVNEPARNLDLTSAALFYRASMEGPLRRVLSHGWEDDHATSLDAESMLVRYLQAEHTSLRLEAVQWLPSGMPEGVAHPVLAIPIVNQHALTAVVLYGGHVNGTLLDPDEIELLSALGKAAATSHQQVRIAILAREKAAVEREAEMQMARNAQLEASLRLLAQERSGAQS
jgi:hypothetical protein